MENKKKHTYSISVLIIILLIALSAACKSASTVLTSVKPNAEFIPVQFMQKAEMEVVRPDNERPSNAGLQEPNPVSAEFVYEFTEGPTADGQGNIYFSDINAGKIYKWTPDGKVSVYFKGLSQPNGLAFDKNGNLIICEGGKGRLISLDAKFLITVLADLYNGIRFNEPNDLWIDPQGGIYFTDPAYQSPLAQDGEHVYYLSPSSKKVMRVIADLVRPNGIVGKPDGKTLYVADHGAGKTYVYDIAQPGKLLNKRLFVSSGSDGIELDSALQLYLTTPNKVQIYAADGTYLRDIPIKENPTNIAFGGKEKNILFITARTAVYTYRMPPQKSPPTEPPQRGRSTGNSTPTQSVSDFILTSPDVSVDGTLPGEFTCDGASATIALHWSGAPASTQEYALIMHHVANADDVHWYWVLYNIPSSVTSLPKNSTGIGTLGTNSVNKRTEYAPPCSKGPGLKTYTYTVYALSAQPQLSLPAEQVNREALLNGIDKITIARAELNVTYERKKMDGNPPGGG